MYQSVVLRPGEGRSFPGPYLGTLGSPGQQVAVNWYASACADSADVPNGVVADPRVRIDLNYTDANGNSANALDDEQSLVVNGANYEWPLQPYCQDGKHYVIRLKNTGNVPVTVEVHRDLR